MRVAVVILNWNGKGLLERLLPALVEHTHVPQPHLVDLIVADNGSTDGSLEFVQSQYPDTVQTMDLHRNHGFAEGYNRALADLQADCAVLLNSDVEVSPQWLEPLLVFMNEHPEVAACQPKIRSFYQRDQFEHAGAAGGYIDALGFPFCRGRMMAVVEKDKGQYDCIRDVFWTSGACMCVRLDRYREVGGLDARFFAHMEEIDLCWRLKSKGYRLVCVPQSVVYHMGGATLDVENPQKVFLNYRNNLLMLYKNETTRRWRWLWIVRFFMDYLAAVVFLFQGKPKHANAIWRARVDFKSMRRSYKDQRTQIHLQAKTHAFAERYKGSLLLDYYLLGKRRFQDLSIAKNLHH